MAFSGDELSEVLASESELIEDGLPAEAQPQERHELLSDSEGDYLNSASDDASHEPIYETMESELLPVDASHEFDERDVADERGSLEESSAIESASQYSEENSIVSARPDADKTNDDQADAQAGVEALNYIVPKQEDGEGIKRNFLGKIPSFKRSLRRFSSAQDLRTEGRDDNSIDENIKLSRRRKSFSFFKSDSARSTPRQSKRKKIKALSASVVRYFKSRKRETNSAAEKSTQEKAMEGAHTEGHCETPRQRPGLQRKLSFSGGAKSLLRKLSSARLLRIPRQGKSTTGETAPGKEAVASGENEDEDEYSSDGSSVEVTGFEHLFYAQILQRLVKTWKSEATLLEKLVAALAPLGMLVTLLSKLAKDIEVRFSQDVTKQERAFYAVCGLVYTGSTFDKSTFLYLLCDIDGDGKVSKNDFKKVLTEIAWSDTTPLLALKENQPTLPRDGTVEKMVLETKLNVFYILNDPFEIRRLDKTLKKYKWKDVDVFAALSRKYKEGKPLKSLDRHKLQDVALSVNFSLESMDKDGDNISFQDYLSWISKDEPELQYSENSQATTDWFSLCPEPIWDYPMQDLETFPVRVCCSRVSDVKKISTLRFRRRNLDVRDGKAVISKGATELFQIDLLDQTTEIELIARPGHRHPETIYLHSREAELFLQSSSSALHTSMQEVLRILKVNTHEAYLPRDYSEYSQGSYQSSEQ